MDVKLGVIGYGYWGPNLVRNLMETEGAAVVSCADLRPDRRALAQQRYPPLKVTDDADAILDDSELDAVVLATPLSTHYALAKRALEQGKHVLVEKPMTRTAAEAEELMELADSQGLVLMVDHTFIYTGAVRRMKELLTTGGRAGRPLLLRLGPGQPRHLPA
jgi:predicted dehydrogenase